jgi:hypothetical protein
MGFKKSTSATRKQPSFSPHLLSKRQQTQAQNITVQIHVESFFWCGNDPSAGSPTETLLRLHLPLNGEVKESSHESIRNEAN